MKLIAAMITAAEETLEAAVASIRPHVDAVVAVVTKPATAEDLARYDKVFDHYALAERHFPRGEDGEIEWERADFGAARSQSFDLARADGADAIVWLDSDDEVVGAEPSGPRSRSSTAGRACACSRSTCTRATKGGGRSSSSGASASCGRTSPTRG